MSLTIAKLGDITKILSGTTPDSANTAYWNGHHIWVTPTDLGKLDSWTIVDSARRISGAGLASCNLPLIPTNAVVMSSRAPIGHLAIAGVNLHTNQGCKSFVCGERLHPEFLFFMLKYRMPDIQVLGSGSTFAEVSKSALEVFEIAFPPIEKQRSIAAHLIAQLAAVEEARQAAQAQLRDLKMLAIRLNEEAIAKLSSFKSVTLGELLKGIETGKSFQTSERIASVNELGVLKVSAISWGAFNPQAAKAIDGAYTPDEKHRVRAGDVIITRANTVELVGAVVRVEHNHLNRLLSDKTLRLLLDTNRCDADYIVQVLRLPEARAHLEGNATGSSNSMRNISQGTLRATPIPLPPFHEQQQFSKNMLEVENALNAMRTTIQQQLRDIELLPSRLLAAAFDTPATAPSDDE